MIRGRPKLNPDERRTERHNLRFTMVELEYVRGQADAAGIDVAEYLRRRALGYVVPASPARRAGNAAVLGELNRLGLELKAVGNLANQLALAAHTGRRSRIAWESVVEQINGRLEELEGTLRELVSSDSFDDELERSEAS